MTPKRTLTQRDVEEAYARGVSDTSRDLTPFHAIGQVGFALDRPHFAATVLYEAQLLEHLHHILGLLDADSSLDERADRELVDARRGARDRVESISSHNRLLTGAHRATTQLLARPALQRAQSRVDQQMEVRQHREQIVD